MEFSQISVASNQSGWTVVMGPEAERFETVERNDALTIAFLLAGLHAPAEVSVRDCGRLTLICRIGFEAAAPTEQVPVTTR